MSRTAQQRQQQKLQLQQQQQQQLLVQQQLQMAENESAAAAAEMFDLFCVATTMRQILGLHRNMCDQVGLRPAPLNEFYPKLKAKVRSWKAQALWKKFDARATHRVYAKGAACTGTRVLVIGAGPCGLRTAIEAQLLGAKVVVVEKRDRISRNNVLHLWPFVITDLRNLGAKKFYGKFCAGSIDHISIRQLQCILLKVALLLGVEIHEGVSFERSVEPSDGCGWRAAVTPPDHAVSHYEFDMLIGADGKRNTLEGFRRKEFRGKLAIAITANFINKKTEAEAKVEEISGVAFIFNQSFFKELYHTTGIDLENIVYYKDETHYFVMTAKKHSLIDKGVIMQDFSDPAELLAPANVNKEKLLDYATEAANFSTKYQMPNLEFAVNHYGKPDVAMFDFTSMFAAETSCRVLVRKGFRLLQCLVGDSLLEPFWPTGSGCARGFLSSMDAAYALKLWSNPQNSTLGVLAQRESIYRLLNQTTPENLQRDIGSYTVDPATRYPNLNRSSVNVWQVKHLIDTDDKAVLEQTFMDTNALQAVPVDTPIRRKRRSGDMMSLSTVLLRWICAQLHAYEFTKDLKEATDVFTNGQVLCALINRYRPDLVDFNEVKDLSPIECNEIAFRILDKELHIPRIMSGKDSMHVTVADSKAWLNYLEQICEVFRGEIPHVKHPKMDVSELREKYRTGRGAQPDFSKLLQISTKQKQQMKTPMQDTVDVPQTVQRRSVLDEDKLKRQRKYDLLASGTAAGSTTGASGSGQQAQTTDTPRRAKKRRSAEKATNIEERQKRLQDIEQNRQDRQSKRRQQRYQQTQNFYKSLHMLQANILLRESDDASPFEDYSIFLYRQQAPEFNDRVKDLERKLLYPDRDRGDIPSALPRGATDEQFSDRIKSMEQRISSRTAQGTDKKPKDLMRAIGKIDSSDWNVRSIEKKIEQSKRTEIHGPQGREKVPKWSKEQFQARQHKMAKPTRQNSNEEKFKEIDQTLKNLDRQLKEGNVLEVGERGRNKVASIAGQFVKKDKDDTNTSDEKNPPTTVVPKSSSKVALAFKKQAASEKCHFCNQTVYLMERVQTEGLTLHRSCLKCHHCHNNLRLGGYAFDRDDPQGRFYCTQHFRLPAKPQPVSVRRPGQRKPTQQQQAAAAAANVVAVAVIEPKTPEVKLRVHADSVAQLDSMDRGQTPERIEFENTDAMSDGGEPSEEHVIDEHEWSGRNFLPESNNDDLESDLSSSDDSESDSDADLFEEANDDSPLGAQTLQLATDWIGKQNYSDSDESDDFYDSSESIVDDGKDDTEGEEFKKARELRREEVRLLPPPANLPTDTETEVQSDSESTSRDEVEANSATEISTDSEFDHDEKTRERETPKIYIDDTHLRKPTKVQIKSTVITTAGQAKCNPSIVNSAAPLSYNKGGSYLAKYQPRPPAAPQPQFKPLVQVDPTLLPTNRTPLQNPRPGDYLLNKTASTEGIASKKSLELKKRYLLGEQANGNKIQKSGSTSVLDSRIRSFQSNISECQKLLNPSHDVSTKSGSTNLNEENDLMRSATTNILNDLKVEITIQKAISVATAADHEKENVFVNSKNELNKGMEYSETVNTTLLESSHDKRLSPTTPSIIETIDLVTPEKPIPIAVTNVEMPLKMSESNVTPTNNSSAQSLLTPTTDSNKIIDLTCDSPVKSDKTITEEIKPDVSKDVKERPDILKHCENKVILVKQPIDGSGGDMDEAEQLLSHSGDEEKRDSPEKIVEKYEQDSVQIQVPNIPWHTRKQDILSSTTVSSCSSHSSSVEDIQHYILESTTSPDTHNSGVTGAHLVPRLEIHDSTGTLLQMVIDGHEDLAADADDVDVRPSLSEGLTPEIAAVRTCEVDDETEDGDVEPITATPEPADCTVIEADERMAPPPLPEHGPPLPSTEPPLMKPANLRFDTKNENKIESLKHLPLIVEQTAEHTRAIKPITLNLSNSKKSPNTPTTPTATAHIASPMVDNDKTPTAELLSRGSDSETEHTTGTGQVLTETELSDWTADDCISENFVDIEFALNSNKGTIRRNKKGRKKLNSPKLPSTSEVPIHPACKSAPVAEFEGIDIDDIEFMDTGSEGSCAEAYAATNTALLRNHGYIEFIETTPEQTPRHMTVAPRATAEQYTGIATKRDEKLGIDYIEQGAYLLHDHHHDAQKTPVNECPPILADGRAQAPTASGMTQSLTDSSTLNDLDEDSVCIATATSQAQLSSLASINTKMTTDESEALTKVTSPADSSSPRTQDPQRLVETTAGGSTPSSSEKIPRTSLSTCTRTSSASTNSSGRTGGVATPPQRSSQEVAANAAIRASTSANITDQRKPSDELSYEEYVRALQQKITQISTARDSVESRKQRRKSSKGDAPSSGIIPASSNVQTVIEKTPGGSQLQLNIDDEVIIMQAQSAAANIMQVHKVPEIPTLTRKLEEITKERTKQKDLIHDLVMDKLQSKKQLNAEKRLHRSRQRTMLTSGYASGCSLSPTPKIPGATTTSDANCTNKAHYHVSTAAAAVAPVKERPLAAAAAAALYSTGFKENQPLQRSATSYIAAYCKPTSPNRMPVNKQRPFSEHLDAELQPDALAGYKLSKTPSTPFVVGGAPMAKRTASAHQLPLRDDNYKSAFATPHVPGRQQCRDEPSLTVSTENLRSEARARARLKSNSELGLSPEEKMQLLRKRLYAEQVVAAKPVAIGQAIDMHKHDDDPLDRQLDARTRKMSASKSVNDLAYMAHQTILGGRDAVANDDNSNMKASAAKTADFTSDPNLLLSSAPANGKQLKAKSGRRPKEPERRKSLIQSLSSFFHKSSSASNGGAASAVNSAHAERLGTSDNSNGAAITPIAAGSAMDGGMFSRFRISPKSKEKSKDKEASSQIAVNNRRAAAPAICRHQRSNSQDSIYTTQQKQQQQQQHNTYTSNPRRNNRQAEQKQAQLQHTAVKSSSTTTSGKAAGAATFSSSSPQLCANKTARGVVLDEQTPPPIPPLPLNYQRSDDESYATETREQKKQRAISKAVRQAELKRLRIAQEIQREQEEIEVQLKELEARGVLIEKALRGEGQHIDNTDTTTNNLGNNDEKLLKELLEIWRNITQLKKRDEELSIRQQELQLEHRHAQLKDELNLRLSCNKLDKSSADVAAEGAILNEMLEIVAKRAALRPLSGSLADLTAISTATTISKNGVAGASTSTGALTSSTIADGGARGDIVTLTSNARGRSLDNDESHI